MSNTLHIFGNWKQNLKRAPARECAQAIARQSQDLRKAHPGLRVGLAPTFVALPELSSLGDESPNPVQRLAQNVAAQETGAFTGEIGAQMLLDCGCAWTLIGHSERRQHFHESDEILARKLSTCAEAGLGVVFCVGEALEQRQAGTHEDFVIAQLASALDALEKRGNAAQTQLIIAYEPIWAIGTGQTATPEQASLMHRKIREYLKSRPEAGGDRSILYGGSVKASNAAELLAAGEIDGFLVGGASLKPETFLPIIQAGAEHLSQ